MDAQEFDKKIFSENSCDSNMCTEYTKPDNTNNEPRYIFIVRHGEKDFGPDNIKTNNPDLTDHGEKQAIHAGKYMADWIKKTNKIPKEIKASKIHIMCSYYLRCLETATFMIHALKEQGFSIHNNTLHVTTGLNKKKMVTKLSPLANYQLKEDANAWIDNEWKEFSNNMN